ncbi:MAG TPA: hypothetical protein VG674_17305 [Amycolatopsis sp.]|nr:hypothetical protein [Amycolatopsis sp.]
MTPPPTTGRLGDTIIAPLQPPADVHLDDTSDNMIASLSGFHDKMTGKLGQLYARWIGHPARNLSIQFAAPYDKGDEENRLMNELRGFGFGYFWGAQERAANLGKAAKAAQDAGGQAKKDLGAAWQGKAADSAAEKLDDFGKAAGDYGDTVNGFSQLLQNLWHTVRQPILDMVKLPDAPGQAPKIFLDAHNPDDCDGLSMFIDRLDDAIKWGREDAESTFGDDLTNPRTSDEVATSQEEGTGPIAPQDIRNMWVDVDTGYYSKWSHDLCDEMDQYCTQYSNAMTTFRQAITNAHNAATNALRAFNDGLNVPTDPFGSLQLGASPDSGGGTRTSGAGGRHSASDSGGPSSAGGAATPTTPAAAPQPAPTPAPPAPTPAPTPTPADPNLNPVTHQALEVDPATGKPYPIDPTTGEAVKAEETEPEAVTVERGNNKISMVEPDDDGRMGITVDDGTGRPEHYQLDFGDQAASGHDGATADQGQHAFPGSDQAQHAVTGSGQGQHAVPDQGAAPQPGRHEAPGQDNAAASGHIYQPGPDGKIHIDDNGLKITAERPEGADGPTVVTVDDGSGHPTTYTLGEDGDQQTGHVSGDLAQPDSAVHQSTGPQDEAAVHHAVAGDLADQLPGHGGSSPSGSDDGSDPSGLDPSGSDPSGLDPSGLDPSGTDPSCLDHGASDHGASDHGGSEQGERVADDASGAGRHHMATEPVSATASTSELPAVSQGPDDSTTVQSLTDPTDSHSGLGPGADTGLGQTAQPAGWEGGGGTPLAASDLGTAPTMPDDQHGQPVGMMGGAPMAGGWPGAGDQERATNPYQVERGLFDSTSSGRRISGSLLDDEDD